MGMVVWGRMYGNMHMEESMDHCFDVYNVQSDPGFWYRTVSDPGMWQRTVSDAEFWYRTVSDPVMSINTA